MSICLTLGAIADQLGLSCVGDRNLPIEGLAPLAGAGSRHLSFIANKRYRQQLIDTQAAAVIVDESLVADCKTSYLLSSNTYLDYARATQLFERKPVPEPGIHPTAVVSESAVIAADVSIGPHCVVGERVTLAAGVKLDAGCVISDDSSIGENTWLHANVTIYHDIRVGRDCLIHSGTVIGSDGFGFAPSSQGWQKIAQIGGVDIGDRVEIGSNCSIDRGALENTVISDGVIIDNLVHIAHNVKIGENTAIAGCTGIAGSTSIGKQCLIGGACNIGGHIAICDNVHITGATMVVASIEEPGSYSSNITSSSSADWRRNNLRFHKLDEMYKKIKELEKDIKAIS